MNNNKEKRLLSVSELTNAISITLRENIGYVSVQGELSNFKTHSSGHRYFTLKDAGAQISCTMWRSKRLTFEPSDGMKVIINGKISVYPPRGNYQIECDSMVPLGQGDLFLAFEALKMKLEEAGYFDPERKRPLPMLPVNIGVSTSPTGAAVRDIISTIGRRLPICTIYFRPTLVQGEGAADDIAAAITELNNTPSDIIIIGRGGGSLEDLWSYNTEIVAEAIYRSKIPIISAVGHETDFTISDFVADIRAATPTAAAELATGKTVFDLTDFIDSSRDTMNRAISDSIERLRDDIDGMTESYSFRSLPDKIKTYIQQIDETESRLPGILKGHIKSTLQKVSSLSAHLASLEPLSPLKRGFAYLTYEGNILSNKVSLDEYTEIEIVRAMENANVKILNVEKPNNHKGNCNG